MKTKITLLIATVFLITVSNSSAQLNYSGGIGYDNYFEGEISTIHIGVNGEYAVRDEMGLRLSFQYGLPKTYAASFTANGPNGPSGYTDTEVEGEWSVGVMRFLFDAKKYWGDADYDEGGFYGSLGIGLSLASVSGKVTGTVPSGYTVNSTETEGESASQLYIRAHLGYDVKLDALSIFIEPGLDLAANKVNDAEVDVSMPSLLVIDAGIRIQLD